MVCSSRADIVNAAQPLTHCVKVQPIRIMHSGGTIATAFGDRKSELYIKREVNRVWAQAGIRIDWLLEQVHTNDFVFDGSPNVYDSEVERPVGDFHVCFSAIPSPPLSPDPTVINILFVEVVPGFTNVGETSANGRGVEDTNGIIVQIGDILVTLDAGRDLAAAILAHEIGHNLGLFHEPDGNANFMALGGSTDQMTPAQVARVFTDDPGIDGFEMLKPIASPSNYDLWSYDAFLAGSATDDPDCDGLPHLLEFLLGLDPLASDSASAPKPSRDGDCLLWTIQKVPDAVADGFGYSIEVSDDLRTWMPAGTPGTSSSVITDSDDMIAVKIGGGMRSCYMRLQGKQPSP